jgi:hypothetical protein
MPLSIRKETQYWADAIRCLQSKPEDKPIDIALIGDSHAEHLFLGLAERLPKQNVSYYLKNTLPFVDDPEFSSVFQYVLSDPNIKTVIIGAFWYPKLGMVPRGSTLEQKLSATVERLLAAHKRVYLVDDVPRFSFDPAQCKYSRRFAAESTCVQTARVFYSERQAYLPSLQSVANTHPNVKLIEVGKYFCSTEYCSMAMDGKIFYRDPNHLNINGTRYLGQRILEDYPQLAANP